MAWRSRAIAGLKSSCVDFAYRDDRRRPRSDPFREQRSIVFDHLVAPVAFYLRKNEFAGWFGRAGLEEVTIQHHNGNSWRGFGIVPMQGS